jgi:hypothetical protein
VKLEQYKPSCAFDQRYNDAFNSPYLGRHNVGFATIDKRKIENSFLTKSGQISKRSWDFANDRYWQVPPP